MTSVCVRISKSIALSRHLGVLDDILDGVQ